MCSVGQLLIIEITYIDTYSTAVSLEEIKKLQFGERFRSAIVDLEQVHHFCNQLGVKRPLLVCPLLVVNPHLHGGSQLVPFFQTVLQNKSGSTTLAVGGR